MKDTASFQVLFIVSLFCAWNTTTVEINSGLNLAAVLVLVVVVKVMFAHFLQLRTVTSVLETVLKL